jgi:GNAT superfamily N-acetyltransferase
MSPEGQATAPSIVARPAHEDDRSKLAELRLRWTAELGVARADASYSERFDNWFDRQRTERKFWVGEVEGQTAGMLNLYTFERMPRPGVASSRWAYLANMYVVPEYRGSGVSRLLVQTAVEDALSAGCERVVLSPSERSVSFWRRLGFGEAHDLLVYRPDRARPG